MTPHGRESRADNAICQAEAVNPTFNPVVLPDDHDALVGFLGGSEWPYHAVPRLSAGDVAAMDFVTDDVQSFWMVVDGDSAGLIRLLDLGDIDLGSPLFDLRLASAYRGRGLGVEAVRWLTDHLFGNHGALHRIEAVTRLDNLAMQRVFDRCGYTREGRLREAWLSDDGSRTDTLLYAILRSDWDTPAVAR